MYVIKHADGYVLFDVYDEFDRFVPTEEEATTFANEKWARFVMESNDVDGTVVEVG